MNDTGFLLLVRTTKNFFVSLSRLNFEGWVTSFQYPWFFRYLWHQAYEDAYWGDTEWWHRY